MPLPVLLHVVTQWATSAISRWFNSKWSWRD